MNRKTAVLLILILVVLGAASLFLLRRDQNSWQPAARGGTGKVLGEFDPNAVSTVHLKDGEGEVTLVRKNGVWSVEQRDDYPADFERVGNLIRKLWQLAALQTVDAGPSQFGRLQLTEPGQGEGPSATRLEMKDASGKTLSVLLLGKTYNRSSPGAGPEFPGIPVGRFVMVQSDTPQPLLVKDTLSEVVVRAQDWIDRSFVAIPNAQSLTFVNGDTTWTLERPTLTNPWTFAGLKDGEQIDPVKVNAAANVVSRLDITDVQPKDTPFEAQQTLTVKTFNHLTYTLQFGKPIDGEYPARVTIVSEAPKTRTPGQDEKPEDKERLDKEFADRLAETEATVTAIKRLENRTFLVPQSELSPLFVTASDFVTKPAPSPAPEQPQEN